MLGRPLTAIVPPIAVLALATVAIAGCGSSSHSTGGVALIGAGLRGPAGLRATVYARGLPHAAAFAFDVQGRLWAATAGLTAHSRDGVYLISRSGARPVRVIAGLDDPLGLLWHRGALYVASVGRVTAYRRFDGTRFQRQTTIVHGPLARGENNALALAPDGRLVMGITATCDDCAPKSKWSGAIVSFQPDGSDLQVYASRIRAPVGLAFYPGTDKLFASFNEPNDLGTHTNGDVLAAVPRGSDWRFPACHQQGGSACAGVPAPLAALDKHAAVGPVVIVTGQLGRAVGAAALVPEWQTSKVARVTLERSGSGFRGSASVWLTGVRNPFAMSLAPDRSLLVGDWGTGVIYRIAAV